uniref:Uncharacterized protein n=1 Tax=Megaselia scalaris TaxID=36166 RepID=T1GHA2_MEGSC
MRNQPSTDQSNKRSRKSSTVGPFKSFLKKTELNNCSWWFIRFLKNKILPFLQFFNNKFINETLNGLLIREEILRS